MNLIKGIKQILNFSARPQPTDAGLGWFPLGMDPGDLPAMTPGGAFSRVGTVFACVDRRATALAKLPFQVFRRNGEARIRDPDHRMSYLLEKRPNAYQTPMMYKKYLCACQLLWGYAVVYKKYGLRGEIEELIPWKPYEVNVQKIHNQDRYLYCYQGQYYTEDEVIYIPYLSADGKVGKAPLSVARENAESVQAMSRHLKRFYENGALKQGALVSPASLKPESKTKLKKEWKRLNGGSDHAGEVAVLDNGLDWKDISLPFKDAEFIESKHMTENEIASVFNVPPSMLGLSSEKYSNLQEINDRFMEDVVAPDCINIEEAHDFSCFSAKEADYYTKFNLLAGMRGAPEKRAEYYEKMVGIGGLTVNEIRAREELNGIGELGDKHYFSLNYTTLDTLEKHIRIQLKQLKEGEQNESD